MDEKKLLLVGLSGLAGSGKSEASRFISNIYGIPRRPFAFPVKAMIGALGISPEILDGPASVKELPHGRLDGKSTRFALQTLGTEWGRNIMGADFWVNRWLDGLGELGCVADDVRFENEAKAIHSRGGIVIRLLRNGSGVKDGSEGHASEQINNVPYDVTIINDISLLLFKDCLLRAIDRHYNIKWGNQNAG